MKGVFMKNKRDSKNQGNEEHYTLKDFDLARPEVITKSMQVRPKYGGKLKLLKTSVSLPQSIIDDLRWLARIRGMTSYQGVLRELVSEKVYEENRRLRLFDQDYQ
jgi:hypothetical protein